MLAEGWMGCGVVEALAGIRLASNKRRALELPTSEPEIQQALRPSSGAWSPLDEKNVPPAWVSGSPARLESGVPWHGRAVK
jgi:hypothetical protein